MVFLNSKKLLVKIFKLGYGPQGEQVGSIYNDNCFEFTNLYTGTYTYTITDGIGGTIGGEFVIKDTYDFEEMEDITETQTWTGVNYAYELGLTIKDGVELTVESSQLEFGPEAKIIIEAGAKLIVHYSVLTNINCEPLKKWQGIEVWGDAEDNQFVYYGHPLAQGKLTLINSTIKNAKLAVLLAATDEQGDIIYSKTGGIVTARNSHFINNTESLKALYYKNMYPYIPDYEFGNFSFFNNTTFNINSNYIPEDDIFYKHINLSHVKGFDFVVCDFLNTATENVSLWSCGIMAYNAGFSLKGLCTSYISPCPEEDYDRCNLSGFYSAVWAANTSTANNTFSIDHTNFTDNSVGVNANGVHNAAIIFSDFNIGYNSNPLAKEECSNRAISYGIDMIGCTGFAIEENYFTKAQGAATGYYVGVYIAETQATEEVYKNTFDGLSYGNYAVGQNWGDHTYEGLAYYCNENTGNWQDITVKKNSQVPPTGGIQNPIGTAALPSGNTFSSNANCNIYNDGDYWFGYFYYAPSPGNTNTPYYPDEVYRVTREEVVGIQNECPSHYGGNPGDERGLVLTPEQKLETEQEFVSGLNDYNNIRALYDNLQDGGNTTGELLDIETAQPGDMWELRTQLLGDSPHLSMDVLKAAADKTNVFPESAIFDIMAANPDELKKDELINHLEEKENPLPAYMMDILRQVATGSTYKTVLQREMAQANRLKTRAAHDIIRSILNDSLIDYNELRNWLDNMSGIRADEQIIATYMQEGSHNDALTLAGLMPGLYGYNEIELTEHTYYTNMLNIQVNLVQEGRNMLELNSDEVNSLVYIAENSTATAGTQAKGILEYAYGYNYCTCINTDATGLKSSGAINTDIYVKLYGLAIDVKPNPAREWAAFNYNLPDDDTEGTIKITGVAGKLIETLHVTGKQGQKLWDTRKVKSGIYFYTLTVNGVSKSGKVVINK